MEAHPIPQNVTSFQFKLVGDMTLKQFGYLATGVSIAYLIFVTFAINYPLISWPLIVLFAGLGFAFAFVPIGSRPLDHWLKAFLKAVYSPTKRVWEKSGQGPEDPLFKSRLLMYLPSLDPQTQASSGPTSNPPTTLGTGIQPPTSNLQPIPRAGQPLPTTEELDKTVSLARQAQGLQVKIIQTERQLNQLKSQAAGPMQGADYTRKINEILSELQNTLTQASQIKQQLDLLQQPVLTGPDTGSFKQPGVAVQPVPQPRVKLKVALPVKPKQTQLALTTFPNVINGIIKDPQNNYLDGVVVVIYDKEGMPVRALKTNKLGQFSGSTPLPNGTYTIETEKEGHNFDILQIELEGQVIPPLPITAKS